MSRCIKNLQPCVGRLHTLCFIFHLWIGGTVVVHRLCQEEKRRQRMEHINIRLYKNEPSEAVSQEKSLKIKMEKNKKHWKYKEWNSDPKYLCDRERDKMDARNGRIKSFSPCRTGSWWAICYLHGNNVYHKIISYARQSSHEQRSCTWKHQSWLHLPHTTASLSTLPSLQDGHSEAHGAVLISEAPPSLLERNRMCTGLRSLLLLTLWSTAPHTCTWMSKEVREAALRLLILRGNSIKLSPVLVILQLQPPYCLAYLCLYKRYSKRQKILCISW